MMLRPAQMMCAYGAIVLRNGVLQHTGTHLFGFLGVGRIVTAKLLLGIFHKKAGLFFTLWMMDRA